MNDLVAVGLAGFAAAFVDGALGMGFGPTSSSILLATGLPARSVSAMVNIAKVVTGIVGGLSHWRFGNIDRKLVVRLAIPGVFGALLGTYILTNVDDATLRPILAALLMVIGLRILIRFRGPLGSAVDSSEIAANTKGLEVAGAAGGVTNGLIGAWGPVVTPFLLHRRIAPRLVVGSVNTAEVAVALVAAVSLIRSGGAGLEAGTLAAMLIGGVIAAPVAAWTVRFVPARVLGVSVAGLLLLTNARELALWAEVGAARWIVYGLIVVVVGWTLAAVSGDHRPPLAPATPTSA